jgi:hypothetical protein
LFLHFLLKDGSQAKNKRKRGPAPKKKKDDQARQTTTAASSPSAKKKKDSQEKVPRQASKRKAESTAHFSPANVLNSVIPTTTKKPSEEIPPVAAPSKRRKTVDLTKDFLSHIAKCVFKDEIQKLLKEGF